MNTTATWNFERQPSPEEEGFSFSSFIPLWILLGVVFMAVICWFGFTWEARRNCKSFCVRGPWDRQASPSSRTQPTCVENRERVVNETISRANAEIEALLNRNNASVSRANPQNTVNDWPVPHRYTAVRPSAPPASLGTTSDPYREPPSYQQLLASDPRVREQRNITQLENRGFSNTARVLAGIFNTTTQQPSNHDLPRIPTPSTRTSTETNTRRDLIADPAQRSWRAYFNTADRLRELTIYSRTRDTSNETDIPTTGHQPRSQTPPPMYHEVEGTAVRITRSDSLPSYDDFMASPHKYTT